MTDIERADPNQPLDTTSEPSWVTGWCELPNGARSYYYNPSGRTQEEVETHILAEYDAAAPIVELAEATAEKLGSSAIQLLRMAMTRIGYPEEDADIDL